MSESDLLVVAVCAGPRCQALRGLHDPTAAAAGPAGAQLRAAVRERPGAVLVSTGCLGPCARGCVAVVGPGSADAQGRVSWHGRPVGLELVERPDRVAEFAAWVSGPAPDVTRLPERLASGQS